MIVYLLIGLLLVSTVGRRYECVNVCVNVGYTVIHLFGKITAIKNKSTKLEWFQAVIQFKLHVPFLN